MPARILPSTPENIAAAAGALLRGEVVGMPTETVYGLAGLAFDEGALARIFQTKDRPIFDPLIVHVAAPQDADLRSFDWLAYVLEQELVDESRFSEASSAQIRRLSRLWPGPLTLVLPKHECVPDLATSGLMTVAIRAPAHPVAQALLRAAGQPLAAPSANRFGRLSPTSAADVQEELGDRISLILDGGPSAIGLESTVVQVGEDGGVTLLRPGAITREELEQRLQTAVTLASRYEHKTPSTAPASPGLLASHYAPAKPLYLLPATVGELSVEQVARLAGMLAGRRAGLLLYQRSGNVTTSLSPVSAARVLTEFGEPTEAARNFFRSLRELDAHPQVDVLLAEPVLNPTGLGYAIADRLQRASIPSAWE
jgi:L-threonylcarbamoyladenylate synthase